MWTHWDKNQEAVLWDCHTVTDGNYCGKNDWLTVDFKRELGFLKSSQCQTTWATTQTPKLRRTLLLTKRSFTVESGTTGTQSTTLPSWSVTLAGHWDSMPMWLECSKLSGRTLTGKENVLNRPINCVHWCMVINCTTGSVNWGRNSFCCIGTQVEIFWEGEMHFGPKYIGSNAFGVKLNGTNKRALFFLGQNTNFVGGTN